MSRENCGTGAGGFKRGNDCAKKANSPNPTGQKVDARDLIKVKAEIVKKGDTISHGGDYYVATGETVKDDKPGFLVGVEGGYIRTGPGVSIKPTNNNSMEKLATNLSGKVRREHRNGREYLVAPASLIVPGVLNGSKGPLFYPEEEIGKNYLAWNDMPIVLDHPVDESGNPISARDPSVLEKFGLGRVYNAKVEGKLESELWFDVADTRRIYPSIISRLEGNQPIELSTGLFTSNETKKGEFNGKVYEGIARNYQPDHLAILPDKVGACSLKDGCGVLANEEKTSLWTKLGELLGVISPTSNSGCGAGSAGNPGFEQGNSCAKGSSGGSYKPPKGSIYAGMKYAGANKSVHDTEYAKGLVSKLDQYEQAWIEHEFKNKNASEKELHGIGLQASGLTEEGLNTARGYAGKKASMKPGVFLHPEDQSKTTETPKTEAPEPPKTKEEFAKRAYENERQFFSKGPGAPWDERVKEFKGAKKMLVDLYGAGFKKPKAEGETISGLKVAETTQPKTTETTKPESKPWEKYQREGWQKIKPERLYGSHEATHSSASGWYVFDHESKRVVESGLGSLKAATKKAQELSGEKKSAKQLYSSSKSRSKKSTNNGESEVTKPNPLTNEERSDLLDQIIANCDCWEESDRDTLAKMNDLQLNALVANGCGDPDEEEEDDEEEEEGHERSPASVMNALREMPEKDRVKLLKKLGLTVTANAEAKPAKKTSQQWFDEAPEEVRSVVANAIQFQSEQKAQLISQIVANSGKKLTKEFLANKDVNELKTLLAALPAPQKKVDPVAAFFGGAAAPLGASAPTMNEGRFKEDEDNDMAPPTINWAEMASEGLRNTLQKTSKN